MRLGMITPSRGRPEAFHNLCVSVQETTTVTDMFLGVEEDDPQLDQYMALKDHVNISVCKKSNTVTVVNKVAWKALETCNYIIGVPDDMIMRKHGWDTQLIDEFKKYPDGIVFLSLMSDMTKNDGYLVATTRKVCQLMGHYMWPNFEHYHADTWIISLANKIKRYYIIPNYDFTHNHKEDTTKSYRIRDGHVHIVADEWRCSSELMQHDYLAKLLSNHIVDSVV